MRTASTYLHSRRAAPFLSVFALFLLSLSAIAAPSRATCVAETPAQMALDWTTVPPGEIGILVTVVDLPPAPQVWSVPLGPGSAFLIQIAPPTMLSLGDAYVAGVDYVACTDASSGAGNVGFTSDGSFLIKVTYGNSSTAYFIVNAGAEGFGKCFEDGEEKEFPCPVTKGYRGADTKGGYFNTETTVNSLKALVDAIMADAAGGPIDVVIVDHGCEGGFTINGTDMVSLAPADSANLKLFCSLKGKVKSLTLLSCSVGHGAPGTAFLQALSKCLGGITVTAFTGNVETWIRKGRRAWSSYGVANTQASPTPTQRSSWGQVKAMYR